MLCFYLQKNSLIVFELNLDLDLDLGFELGLDSDMILAQNAGSVGSYKLEKKLNKYLENTEQNLKIECSQGLANSLDTTYSESVETVKVYFKTHLFLESQSFLDLAGFFDNIWQKLFDKVSHHNQVFFINSGGFTDSRILYIWLKTWEKMNQIKLLVYSPKSQENNQKRQQTISDIRQQQAFQSFQDFVLSLEKEGGSYQTLDTLEESKKYLEWAVDTKTPVQIKNLSQKTFCDLKLFFKNAEINGSKVLGSKEYSDTVRIGKK